MCDRLGQVGGTNPPPAEGPQSSSASRSRSWRSRHGRSQRPSRASVGPEPSRSMSLMNESEGPPFKLRPGAWADARRRAYHVPTRGGWAQDRARKNGAVSVVLDQEDFRDRQPPRGEWGRQCPGPGAGAGNRGQHGRKRDPKRLDGNGTPPGSRRTLGPQRADGQSQAEPGLSGQKAGAAPHRKRIEDPRQESPGSNSDRVPRIRRPAGRRGRAEEPQDEGLYVRDRKRRPRPRG